MVPSFGFVMDEKVTSKWTEALSFARVRETATSPTLYSASKAASTCPAELDGESCTVLGLMLALTCSIVVRGYCLSRLQSEGSASGRWRAV